MSLKVHLRPEAEADIEDTATWYDRQRKGLGQEFLVITVQKIDSITFKVTVEKDTTTIHTVMVSPRIMKSWWANA
ncbi:hypothetical protein BROC_01586 [Candidatus Brocadiaceae bacterium]|nr:hypothetical protein BROC_01586 [Candidatus Brocadiaceae bacterium]